MKWKISWIVLPQRYEQENNAQLTQSAATLSTDAFKKVWDNPGNVVYDSLSAEVDFNLQ